MRAILQTASMVLLVLAFAGCTSTSTQQVPGPQVIEVTETEPETNSEPETGKPEKPKPKPVKSEKHVVKVSVAGQQYSFVQPWQKKVAGKRQGLAVYLGDGRFLTTGELIADHTYIELEHVRTGIVAPAEVVAVDYDADLALLKSTDAEFTGDLKPLEVAPKARFNARSEMWQFAGSGSPVKTPCRLSRASTSNGYLQYFFALDTTTHIPVQRGIPVVRRGKLVGLCRRYDGNQENMEVVSAPVMQHFLNDLEDGDYARFPMAGFTYSLILNPQLRSYFGLTDVQQGVYVTGVVPPQDDHRLKRGDIILSINGYDIDRKGLYNDPDYGYLPFSLLIRTKSKVGDVLDFDILREGKPMTVQVTLTSLAPSEHPVRPYIHDEAPEFIIAGGFVMQELSRQLLKEWKNWKEKAPQRLRYLDDNQWEEVGAGKHAVLLTWVLPVPGTKGYEKQRFKIIEEINGKEINGIHDVLPALADPVTRGNLQFHVFRFRYPPSELVVESRQMLKDTAAVRQVYRIPKLRHLKEKTE